VLAKRESENYLPRELLALRENVGSEHFRRLEAWDRLTETQKDFYDMKDGLSKVPEDSERILFDYLDDGDRKILTQGFGKHVGACWKKYEIPRQANIDRALRDRGGGDLEHGLALIRKEV